MVDFEEYVMRDPQRMSLPSALVDRSLEGSLRFSQGWRTPQMWTLLESARIEPTLAVGDTSYCGGCE